MRVSKKAIVKAVCAGPVLAESYVRGGGNRNGNEDVAPNAPVQSPRNMKGLQPCACI
jgi:hypothetical protein